MEASNLLAGLGPSSLKGIGDKTEKLLGKLGIYDLGQLIHYYPRAYDLYTDCVSLGDVCTGVKQSVLVRVERPLLVKRGAKTAVSVLNISEKGTEFEAVWFNMPYLRSSLKAGSEAVLRGIVVQKGKKFCMEHPEIYTREAYEAIKGTIQPVYALTAGLKNKVLAKAVKQVFDRYSFLDYLPEELLDRYGLVERERALYGMHFPKDNNELRECRRRVVFDEFLLFLLKLSALRQGERREENKYMLRDFSAAERGIAGIGFELTAAQRRSWEEIKSDLSSAHTMNRLLQGDVGSGKTIIAFAAIMAMASNGCQSAFMAPTEVLAEQHFEKLRAFFESNGISGKRVVLLTGSLSAKDKRAAYEMIGNGEALAVVGTHALIQEKLDFKSLALVITDEQHRFGVKQRKEMSEKGDAPHVLVMSATPIPRTLALILYGDMDISLIDEMPKKRLRIKSCVIEGKLRKSAYSFIKKEIDKGRQAYVICPMIEPNEDLGCENVVEYTKKLKKIFPKDMRIEMLHGRMDTEEKLKIMREYADGNIDILVSTTVIEVGIDVANASVMLIENAERFGLAQLHQLRGRIGRGEYQSYCIFVNGGQTKEAAERLEVVSGSTDGFYIAREDLKLRGQGDLFGLRQSGVFGFDLADPVIDENTLKAASEAAKEIAAEDRELSSEKYRLLAAALDQIDTGTEGVL